MSRTVEIETHEYERSHGRRPRGYGSWGFLVMDGSCSPAVEAATFFAPSSMTYGEAKRWARTHVRNEFPAELASGNLYLEVAP